MKTYDKVRLRNDKGEIEGIAEVLEVIKGGEKSSLISYKLPIAYKSSIIGEKWVDHSDVMFKGK